MVEMWATQEVAMLVDRRADKRVAALGMKTAVGLDEKKVVKLVLLSAVKMVVLSVDSTGFLMDELMAALKVVSRVCYSA